MHVGQQLVDRLIAYGVRRVFGVPGGQTLPLYDGITRRRGAIDHVLMRSETSATYAADAYARVTGRVGVCDATVGAGSVHLVPGLVEAFTSSVPILAIVGDIPRQWSYRRKLASASQGFEQDAYLKPCVKHFGRVEVPEALNNVLRACLRSATGGRPGPAVIELPVDLFVREAAAHEFSVDQSDASFPRYRPAPDPAAVDATIDLLSRAQRPVIVAGGGAITAGCSRELISLADKLRAPVATTVSGKGIIPETHRWSAGVCGSFGIPLATNVLEQADCVIWIGTKAGQGATFDWKLPQADVESIHIDIDPDEIGRNYRRSIGLQGDARSSIAALLARSNLSSASTWDAEELAVDRVEWWGQGAWSHIADGDDQVPPQSVLAGLRRFLRDDDIVVADASLASGWAASRWQSQTAGRIFLAPRGMAGLGWGLPAAIGAAFARREGSDAQRVICIAGDGGWAYSIAELETVARFGLDVKSIVLNNSALAWTKHGAAEFFGPDTISQDFGEVDYAAIAQGFGCHAARIVASSEIEDGLDELFVAAAGEPSVLDVRSSALETPVQKLIRRPEQELTVRAGY